MLRDTTPSGHICHTGTASILCNFGRLSETETLSLIHTKKKGCALRATAESWSLACAGVPSAVGAHKLGGGAHKLGGSEGAAPEKTVPFAPKKRYSLQTGLGQVKRKGRPKTSLETPL